MLLVCFIQTVCVYYATQKIKNTSIEENPLWRHQKLPKKERKSRPILFPKMLKMYKGKKIYIPNLKIRRDLKELYIQT